MWNNGYVTKEPSKNVYFRFIYVISVARTVRKIILFRTKSVTYSASWANNPMQHSAFCCDTQFSRGNELHIMPYTIIRVYESEAEFSFIWGLGDYSLCMWNFMFIKLIYFEGKCHFKLLQWYVEDIPKDFYKQRIIL